MCKLYTSQMITFESLHIPSLYLHIWCISERRVQVKFVYESYWIKVTVTLAEKRPLLSCHPYASVSAWIQLPRWRAHCIMRGWHVDTTTGSSSHHSYPITIGAHSWVVGLRLDGSLLSYMLGHCGIWCAVCSFYCFLSILNTGRSLQLKTPLMMSALPVCI